MLKYEYKLIDAPTREIEKTLNDLGASGWELADVSEISPSAARLYMKRQVPTGTLQLLGG